MSKLYTEEQVKKFFEEHYFLMEKDLEDFISIELPTDEEIWDESVEIYPYPNPLTVGLEVGTSMKRSYFTEGAKWMRDKMKGGGDE
jgi:hypothetical protein